MDPWKVRHQAACASPLPGFERALRELVCGLQRYAEAHAERYQAPIARDYVLGDEWLAAVNAVVGLLNGEIGRLDGGLCWQELENMARAAGFELGLEGRKG